MNVRVRRAHSRLGAPLRTATMAVTLQRFVSANAEDSRALRARAFAHKFRATGQGGIYVRADIRILQDLYTILQKCAERRDLFAGSDTVRPDRSNAGGDES
jgi:hypothetical protein